MDTREQAPGTDELKQLSHSALLPWDGQKMLGYEQLVVSPGIAVTHPDIAHAIDFGVEVVGDIELFAQANTMPVIAITGSNGKSTVTELVGKLIEATGTRALVGGNIGLPALDLLAKSDGNSVVVLELSSFQLETTYSLKPLVATILNVSEDHLDRYSDYMAYVEAKHRIFSNAKNIVVNDEDELSRPKDRDSDLISFGFGAHCDWQVDIVAGSIKKNSQPVVNIDELALSGVHNVLNVAAAFALVEASGIVVDENVISAARAYSGMPHRSQLVAIKSGVTFINDSKATNVGATVAAINSFAPEFDKKIILIAGGDAKGADLSSLADSVQSHVKNIICFGKDGLALSKLAEKQSILVNNLEQAVEQAKALSREGDCILLSPACASTDMFKNYIERGHKFEQLVEAV
jgi:UDP-N-acetylmuramoylalanine--D-glutamate ligase